MEKQIKDILNNTKIEEQIFIPCNCGSEAIQLSYETIFEEVYFAIFYYGKPKRSFWERLRSAWNALKDKPYPDQITLTYEEAKKMADWILGLEIVMKEEKTQNVNDPILEFNAGVVKNILEVADGIAIGAGVDALKKEMEEK